jgi:hypothetical protein
MRLQGLDLRHPFAERLACFFLDGVKFCLRGDPEEKDHMKVLLREWGHQQLRHFFGVDFWRTGQDQYYTQAMLKDETGEDAPCYRYHHSRWPMYTPESDGEFRNVYTEQVARLALGDDRRAYYLFSLARQAAQLAGDCAECGVAYGGSALLLCRIFGATGKKLYLFDSFKGLPAPNTTYDRYFRKGQMAASADAVRALLSEFQSMTEIRVGWMPTTFKGLEEKQFAFVHVDVDLYQSTLDCCAFFYPRLVPRGILLFDEYGYPSTHGEKVAVDEFFAQKPERPMVLSTGQAWISKV